MRKNEEIIKDVLSLRKNLQALPCNPIDFSLDPVAPMVGEGEIKLVILGQDPTVRNVRQRGKITCTLNLDKGGALRTYMERICFGLGLTLENVYATNLFKYFYTIPPAQTPEVLEAHLAPNLELLKVELSNYPDCPVITLGEPVLRVLTDNKQKVRKCWNYKGCGCHYIDENQDKLHHRIFPFPHQPSMRKDLYRNHFDEYLDYMGAMW